MAGAGDLIYPLIEDEANRQLLAEWIDGHEDYRLVDPGASLDDARFDLCILDNGALKEHAGILDRLKQETAPALLPYLLLLPANDMKVISYDDGQVDGSVVGETIDEIVSMPILQGELDWRIKALLRLREQSLELVEREREVRESANSLRAVIEASPDAIVVVDEEGLVEEWNPAAERIFGWQRSSIVGEPNPIIPGAKEEEFTDWLQAIFDGTAHTGLETRRRTKGGELIDVRLSTAPVRGPSEDIVGAMAVIEDVTDRVQRERELRAVRETRSIALKASHAGVWEWDLTSDRVTLHESCERLFGLESGTFPGTYEAFMDYIAPDDRHDLEAALRRVRAEGDQFRATFRIQRTDGVARWVDSRAEVVSDEDGKPARMLGVMVDVTERQERVQQLQVLDRVIRHNLRNDLNVINGYTEALESSVSGDGSEFLERIRRQSDQLLDTMEKSRGITKALASEATPISVDIVAIVERVIGRARDRFPDAEIDLEAPTQAVVSATEHFEYAIEELLDNAVIHNDSDVPTVDVAVVPKEDRVLIRIADDGPGIPAMERNVVTGERDIEPLYHGSGLGLWLVSWVVSRSEGTLTFSEGEPRGSIVTLELERFDTEENNPGREAGGGTADGE